MSEFKQYRRNGLAEMRPYVPGEDLTGISVAKIDWDPVTGLPPEGAMIARNPKNHKDQWLVAGKYFRENFDTSPLD